MKTQDLYHGTSADNILGILKDGVMKPAGGEIFFVRQESQIHTCFVHGADRSRGAAFVVKVKIHIPDHIGLKPVPKTGNPDAWVLQANIPVKTEVIELFVRRKPGVPLEVIKGRDLIVSYLQRRGF
ncbi:MAG: hypothetical protein WBV69_06320 [Candidatus Sulfotelmatobacter sp.]